MNGTEHAEWANWCGAVSMGFFSYRLELGIKSTSSFGSKCGLRSTWPCMLAEGRDKTGGERLQLITQLNSNWHCINRVMSRELSSCPVMSCRVVCPCS